MKARYDVVPVDERPVRLVSSIKQCDEGRFPNLLLLLKIDCTLPKEFLRIEKTENMVEFLNNNETVGRTGRNENSLL